MLRFLLSAVAVWCSLVAPVFAQTWDGGGVAGGATTWNTAANWNPNAVPANDGTANIIMAGTIDNTTTVDINFDINSLTFDNTAGAFTILGGGGGISLTVRGGGITNNDTQTQTISLPLVLGAAQTWNAAAGALTTTNTVNVGTNPLNIDGGSATTINGVVQNTTGLIVKNGAGTLTLGNANLFSGGVTLNTGGIIVANNTAFGSGTLTLNGGSLQGSGTGKNLANPVTLGGDFTVGGSVGIVFSGAATLTGNRTITTDNVATTTFSNAIGENAAGRSFTKAGIGLLSIGGSAANTYTGATNVNVGILALAKTGGVNAVAGALNIGDGAGGANADVVLLLGSNQINDASTVSISSSGQLDLNNFSETIGTLTFTGSGNVTTGSGALTVNNALSVNGGGQVNVAAAGQLSSVSNLNVGTATTGGTLSVQGSSATATVGGASTLSVGHATTGTATVNIGTTTSGGTLTSGTGQVTINPTGTLNIGSGANTGTFNANGNVVIDGGVLTRTSGSTFTLAAGKTLMIQNGGQATFTGDYTTAGGTHTITGSVSRLETLTSGAININGVTFNVQSGGTLASAAAINVGDTTNGTLSVDGSGGVSSVSAVAESTWGKNGATANVSFSNGATGSFAFLNLVGGTVSGSTANLDVLSNADLTTASIELAIAGGSGTSATLNLQGNGSTLTQSGTSKLTVGHNLNGTAVINVGTTASGATFSTGTGAVLVDKTGTVNVGSASTTGTFNALGNLTVKGALNVASGSTLSLAAGNSLTISNGGTASFIGNYITASSVTYNVGDAAVPNSVVDISGAFTVDNGAQVNLTTNGTLSVGSASTTTVGANGTINLNGGTFNTGALAVNGTLAFNSGTLGITGTGGLEIGNPGPLGNALSLGIGQTLNITNTVTIDSGASLTLNGGTLNIGDIEGLGTFLFNSGTLGITKIGAQVRVPILTGSNTTINILNQGIVLGGFGFDGFNHQGTLNVGSNSVTLSSTGYARLGVLTTLNGGGILASFGVALPSGSNLIGNGIVSALVAADIGSVIQADGPLALGTASSPAGFISNGELRTKQFAVTLNSSAQATLGNLTTLGNGASPGTLNATNGALVDFGDAITGFGTVTSTNTLAKRTIVNGVAQGNSVARPITFSGYVKGVGTFDNVTFTGTFDPGLSPTLLTAGNLAFSSTSLLNMELGGLARGSAYDAIDSSGQLAFDGTLQISLINGFNPVAGNSFDLFDGTMVGTFDTIGLPSLGANLMWNGSQLYTAGVLSVAVAGDYNLNGTVDAADYVVWRNTLNQIGPGLPADGDNNGQIDNDDYNVWRANFGQTAASGSGATGSASASAAVPEPTTWLLMSLCFGAAALYRKR